MPKKRWRKHLMEVQEYLDPNTRIKQHRSVKLDVMKTSEDESERWHHSQPPSPQLQSGRATSRYKCAFDISKASTKMQNETTCQATKGNKKRHKLGDKLGNKGDKALGRRTRLPTKENKKKDRLGDKRGDKMGDKLETRQTRPWEGGHTIQQRETRRERSWETSWETRSGRQAAGQGRQGLGMADTHPTKEKRKTSWETREARPREGGHTIQQKEAKRETSWDKLRVKRDKASERRTHHPTKGQKKTSWETSGGDKMGDKLEDKGDKGDKASGRPTHLPTKGRRQAGR